MSFISVVPSIRTIPGVDEFDYRVDTDADLRVGDIIVVPFRKREIPAMIVERKPVSAFAERTRHLEHPDVLLRGGNEAAALLARSAFRAFVSRPTVLHSWLRDVPKRGRFGQASPTVQTSLGGTLERRYLIDRWHGTHGLLPEARNRKGRTLLLTPWQSWADRLGSELGAPVLHAGTTATAAWNAVRAFAGSPDALLVATRIGAWLSLFADSVLLDEPENDDYKQDELSPRLDARWLVAETATLRSGLSILAFGTTPRLGSNVENWKEVPDLDLPLTFEPFRGRGRSEVEGMSAAALAKLQTAMDEGRPVVILHPVRGERARIACRDCGWQAVCPACGFPVSLAGSTALCRRCGKKSAPPDVCPSCGGFEFSRGRAGADRIRQQIHSITGEIPIVDTSAFFEMDLPEQAFVVVTDLSLIGGAAEDIRRRERLVIAIRRLAAKIAGSRGELHALGPEETIEEAQNWLTAEGVKKTWEAEREDRKAFGYPPAAWMAKILIAGSEASAMGIVRDLRDRLPSGLIVRGPFPVPYRAKTRGERQVIHLVSDGPTTEKALRKLLDPLIGRAIIDLDPIAFFA